MRVFICFVLTMTISANAWGQKVPPAQAFGAREDIQDISLSPRGNKIAYLGASGARGTTLYIIDLDSKAVPKGIIASSGDPEKLIGCNWVSELRLICTAGAVLRDGDRIMAATKLFAINADGTQLKRVTLRQSNNAAYRALFGGAVIDLLPGSDGDVLIGRQYVPESKMGSIIEKRAEGYGVDRVNTLTLASKRVVPPLANASEFYSDGVGNVRVMGSVFEAAGGYSETKSRYSYKMLGGDKWLPLSTYDWNTEAGFNPYAVDPTENVAYGFDRVDGRQALFKVALDGSDKRTLVFARPDVDVDGLVQIGRQRRVVGVSYALDKREVEYFDPSIRKLRSALSKALPQFEFVQIIDTNSDELRMIIWAGSDILPGQYYHFDKATSQLSELFPSRPELADYKLAPVKSVQVKVGDGTLIPAYLTLPPGSSGKGLPTIVMPHGGPSARDEWGFDWLSQYFANRGYAVLQPNYRGSSGFGDAWFRNQGFKKWDVAIGDVTDAGRWLVQQGIADPNKLAIVGWSYGGYAALQSAVVAPTLFKAVVAVAPVTDLSALLTQGKNYTNYRALQKFVGSGPHIGAGSPAQHADAIKAPVLLFHGELDQNVLIAQSRLMEDRLRGAGKRVELNVYPGLTHGLDDSAVRAAMLQRSDAFLRSAMGM